MKKFKLILKQILQASLIGLLMYAAYLAAIDLVIDKYDAIVLAAVLLGVIPLLEEK